MRSKNIDYIAGVDHIRAFASLLVVFHHSFWLIHRRWEPPGLTNDTWIFTNNPVWSLAIETHIVVTLFFVLSGFMFSLVGAGREIKYGPFMRNRALRVAPVYLAILLFGMAVFPERVTWAGFVSSATLLGNSVSALNLWPVTTTFWTVAVELQFYVIFPFLNTFLNREGAKPLLFLLAFAIALRLVGTMIGTSVRDMNYWHLPGRIDAFILGMLLARLHLRYRLASRTPWLIVPAIVALLGTTFALNQLGGWPAQHWWKALWPTVEAVACSVFVLGYLSFSHHLPKLVSRTLAYLGELSFSTYLVHFMVMQGLYDQGLVVDFRALLGLSAHGDAAANTLLIIMPASLLVSFLAYNGIEAPFMRLRGVYVQREREAALHMKQETLRQRDALAPHDDAPQPQPGLPPAEHESEAHDAAPGDGVPEAVDDLESDEDAAADDDAAASAPPDPRTPQSDISTVSIPRGVIRSLAADAEPSPAARSSASLRPSAASGAIGEVAAPGDDTAEPAPIDDDAPRRDETRPSRTPTAPADAAPRRDETRPSRTPTAPADAASDDDDDAPRNPRDPEPDA